MYRSSITNYLPLHKDDKRIKFSIADVENLRFKRSEFDRVIATCLLHHLEKPVDSFNQIRRVTKNGGLVTILLSIDPGLFFRFIRSLTADRFLRKRGISNVKLLRAVEHRNHAGSLIAMISDTSLMDEMQTRSFPI